MTERPDLTPEQNITDTETEIIVRKVEEIIRANDPDEIRLAAAVVAQLPHFGVKGEALIERHTLREKILLQLGRIGSR